MTDGHGFTPMEAAELSTFGRPCTPRYRTSTPTSCSASTPGLLSLNDPPAVALPRLTVEEGVCVVAQRPEVLSETWTVLGGPRCQDRPRERAPICW